MSYNQQIMNAPPSIISSNNMLYLQTHQQPELYLQPDPYPVFEVRRPPPPLAMVEPIVFPAEYDSYGSNRTDGGGGTRRDQLYGSGPQNYVNNVYLESSEPASHGNNIHHVRFADEVTSIGAQRMEPKNPPAIREGSSCFE